MSVTPEELSLRIRSSREACGLTQEQVAKRLGISRPAVVQIEHGHCGLLGTPDLEDRFEPGGPAAARVHALHPGPK